MKKKIIDLYLLYFNDFLTVGGFADYIGASPETAERIIKIGRKLNNIKPKNEKHPLMYNGWIIRHGNELNKDKLCAYNFKTDVFINPLYKTWPQLKAVIDATK